MWSQKCDMHEVIWSDRWETTVCGEICDREKAKQQMLICSGHVAQWVMPQIDVTIPCVTNHYEFLTSCKTHLYDKCK